MSTVGSADLLKVHVGLRWADDEDGEDEFGGVEAA